MSDQRTYLLTHVQRLQHLDETPAGNLRSSADPDWKAREEQHQAQPFLFIYYMNTRNSPRFIGTVFVSDQTETNQV